MIRTCLLVFIAFISLALTSCKKDDIDKDLDIYVAGSEGGVAKYWKNGTSVILTDGSQFAVANSIAIAGNDIYVSGVEGNIAKYWKNGTAVPLSDGSRDVEIYDMDVSQSDVYIIGMERQGYTHFIRVWKNGYPLNLLDSSMSSSSMIYSIAVSGNDIYLSGVQFGVGMHAMATYWKNGKPVYLTNGSQDAIAYSIALSGNDVYVAGVDGNILKYWKNGKDPVSLTNNSQSCKLSYTGSVLYPMILSGTDVYISGEVGDGSGEYVGKYWKNNSEFPLTEGAFFRNVSSIAVSGNDVYVAGMEGDLSQHTVAKYWKNGKPIFLTDGSKDAYAYSIALSKR